MGLEARGWGFEADKLAYPISRSIHNGLLFRIPNTYRILNFDSFEKSMHALESLASFELLAAWPGWIQWLGEPANLLVVLKVAVGLGFIIFVHELGHFAVAKWCGVKCEKFYVGFDVPIKLGWGKWGIRLPSSLWKRQWGETEYGIGILPLGGYVKMLGQDDNPTRAAEAQRLSRMKAEVATEAAAAGTNGVSTDMVSEGGAVATATAEEEEYMLDPRSYMAKSVPQRMAIISAGVVMNVIFAVVFASIAYGLGVPYDPPVVGHVIPGQGAWRADFQAGDRILAIDGKPIEKFIELRSNVTSLTSSDIADGVAVRIQRGEEILDVNVRPESTRSIVMLGITSVLTMQLRQESPTRKHTPAEKRDFKPRDVVIRIDDEAVETQRQFMSAMARREDDAIAVTVRRKVTTGDATATPVEEEITFEVDRRKRRWVGAWMRFSEITAIQDGSPAANVGIEEGDKIVSIDGRPADEIDPITWPSDVRRFATKNPGEKVTLVVNRDGKEKEFKVLPRVPTSYDAAGATFRAATSNLALGIAYEVRPIVAGVSQGEASDKLKPGDEILKAWFVPADEELAAEEKKLAGEYGLGRRPIDFNDEKFEPTWTFAAERMLIALSGTKMKLAIRRDGEDVEVELPVIDQPGYYHVNRGLQFDPWKEVETAESAGQAISKGLRQTGHDLTAVARFLRKITNDPQAGENLGSVLTIGGAAGIAAQQGWSELLMFMTLISANLAIINFLPIPVLDGGHMVFLTYEGIRGKPADERVFGILTMIGFAMLLTLMVFVFWLDIERYFL